MRAHAGQSEEESIVDSWQAVDAVERVEDCAGVGQLTDGMWVKTSIHHLLKAEWTVAGCQVVDDLLQSLRIPARLPAAASAHRLSICRGGVGGFEGVNVRNRDIHRSSPTEIVTSVQLGSLEDRHANDEIY